MIHALGSIIHARKLYAYAYPRAAAHLLLLQAMAEAFVRLRLTAPLLVLWEGVKVLHQVHLAQALQVGNEPVTKW